MILIDIIKIAVLCILLGGASIPFSFNVNSSPYIVWLGNALGSLVSAIVVIYIGNRITSNEFKEKASKRRVGKKVVNAFEEGDSNKAVVKAGEFINKHGLRFFSFVCPIFPGVLLSTVAVYALDLNKKIYIRWMLTGVVIASGFYVFSYWKVFIK